MALMTNTYAVTHSLTINLIFDDNSTKSVEVEVGDIITVTYNNNGVRASVKGKVTNIFEVDPSCSYTCNAKWAFIIDGSSYGYASTIRIREDRILDLDMVTKGSDSSSTTTNSEVIKSFDSADQALATKILALLPTSLSNTALIAIITKVIAILKAAQISDTYTADQLSKITTEVLKQEMGLIDPGDFQPCPPPPMPPYPPMPGPGPRPCPPPPFPPVPMTPEEIVQQILRDAARKKLEEENEKIKANATTTLENAFYDSTHAMTADNAATASYAVSAGTALYALNTAATNAGTADYSSNAGTASYAVSAATAEYAKTTIATTVRAEYATNAGTASYASTADYTKSADVAKTSEYMDGGDEDEV